MHRALPPRWVRRALHAVYTGVVLFVSLWPRECVDTYVAHGIQRQERGIHFLCFAGLAILSAFAYGDRRAASRSRIALWLACSVFGLVLEVLQGSVPGINRNCTAHDMFDNALGALVGVVLVPVGRWPRRDEEGASGNERTG